MKRYVLIFLAMASFLMIVLTLVACCLISTSCGVILDRVKCSTHEMGCHIWEQSDMRCIVRYVSETLISK